MEKKLALSLLVASSTCQCSAAFNAYEGWGGGFLEKLSEQSFNRLRAVPLLEERTVTGGTKWRTLAKCDTKRELLFQCTSAAIARGTTMIPSTLRQGW